MHVQYKKSFKFEVHIVRLNFIVFVLRASHQLVIISCSFRLVQVLHEPESWKNLTFNRSLPTFELFLAFQLFYS